MDKDEKYRQYVLIFILLGLCYVFYNIFFRDNSEIDNQKIVIRTNSVTPIPVEDPFFKNNEIPLSINLASIIGQSPVIRIIISELFFDAHL